MFLLIRISSRPLNVFHVLLCLFIRNYSENFVSGALWFLYLCYCVESTNAIASVNLGFFVIRTNVTIMSVLLVLFVHLGVNDSHSATSVILFVHLVVNDSHSAMPLLC